MKPEEKADLMVEAKVAVKRSKALLAESLRACLVPAIPLHSGRVRQHGLFVLASPQ